MVSQRLPMVLLIKSLGGEGFTGPYHFRLTSPGWNLAKGATSTSIDISGCDQFLLNRIQVWTTKEQVYKKLLKRKYITI